jgi:hypothetical protein
LAIINTPAILNNPSGSATSGRRVLSSENNIKRYFFRNSFEDAYPDLMTRNIIKKRSACDPSHVKTESI